MKIRSVGAESFHVDGWTDTTKVIVAFRNLGKAPNDCYSILVLVVITLILKT